MAREKLAHKAVFTISPTTVAGVAALLEHVAQPEFLREDEALTTDRRSCPR
jgi:hypothetical protein